MRVESRAKGVTRRREKKTREQSLHCELELLMKSGQREEEKKRREKKSRNLHVGEFSAEFGYYKLQQEVRLILGTISQV